MPMPQSSSHTGPNSTSKLLNKLYFDHTQTPEHSCKQILKRYMLQAQWFRMHHIHIIRHLHHYASDSVKSDLLPTNCTPLSTNAWWPASLIPFTISPAHTHLLRPMRRLQRFPLPQSEFRLHTHFPHSHRPDAHCPPCKQNDPSGRPGVPGPPVGLQ